MAIDPEVNRPTADQLQAKEKDDKVARDKVIRYLTDFELIDKARLYLVQLSGGQRQRCAIIQQICYPYPVRRVLL